MKKYISFAFLFLIPLSYAAVPTVKNTTVLDANNVLTVTHELVNGTGPVTITTMFEDYIQDDLPKSKGCKYSKEHGIITQTCELSPANGSDTQYVSYYIPPFYFNKGLKLSLIFQASINNVLLSPNYANVPLP